MQVSGNTQNIRTTVTTTTTRFVGNELVSTEHKRTVHYYDSDSDSDSEEDSEPEVEVEETHDDYKLVQHLRDDSNKSQIAMLEFYSDRHRKIYQSCCICLDVMDQNNVSFHKCGHVNHTICINKWTAINNTCPLCRTIIK